jgi:hypothetical protein
MSDAIHATEPNAAVDAISAADPVTVDSAAAGAGAQAAANDKADESARTRKYASIGQQGIFQVSTRLLGEKEIDIDDRQTNLLFTLEMLPVERWEFKLENVEVTLIIDPDNKPEQKNIAIGIAPDNMMSKGRLILIPQGAKRELFPGAALNVQLIVRTGVFSSKELNGESAVKGIRDYDVEIEYDLMPVVGDTRNTTYTQLVFYVADD